MRCAVPLCACASGRWGWAAPVLGMIAVVLLAAAPVQGHAVRVCAMQDACERPALCDVVENTECASVYREDKGEMWQMRVTCSPTTHAWRVDFFVGSDAQCTGTPSEQVLGDGPECKSGLLVTCNWNDATEVNPPTEEPHVTVLKEDVFPGAYAAHALAAGENMYNEVLVSAGVEVDDGKTHILATSGTDVWSLGVAGTSPGAAVWPLVRPGGAYFAAGGDRLVFAEADAGAYDDGASSVVHLSGAAAGGFVRTVPYGGVADGALVWVRMDAAKAEVSLVLVPSAADATAVRVLCAECAAKAEDVAHTVYLPDEEQVVWVYSASAVELRLARFDVDSGTPLDTLPLSLPSCCRPVTSAHVVAAALLDGTAYVAVETLMSGQWNVMVFAYESGDTVRATFNKLVGGRVASADKVWPSALVMRDGEVALVMVASDATTPTVLPVWADDQGSAGDAKFALDARFGEVADVRVLSAPTWTGGLLFNVRDNEGRWRLGQLVDHDDDADNDDDDAMMISLVSSLDVPPYCEAPSAALTLRGNELYFACVGVPGVFFWSSDESVPPTTLMRTAQGEVNATSVDALNWVGHHLLISARGTLFSVRLNSDTPPAPNGSALPKAKSKAAMTAGVVVSVLVVVGFLIYAMSRRRRKSAKLNRQALLGE